MGTREMGIDVVFSWPDARICLNHPESAQGNDFLEKEFGEPYYSAEHFIIEDIIDSRETRPTLINTFATLAKKQAMVWPWKNMD